jgi:hypothetical protein
MLPHCLGARRAPWCGGRTVQVMGLGVGAVTDVAFARIIARLPMPAESGSAPGHAP